MTKERLNPKGVRTLVIDSDSFGLSLLTEMLHGFGFDNVKTATLGEQAKLLVQNEQFDLCICEANLPDIPAIELIKWIRRLPTNVRFLPILALTGYSNVDTVMLLRDAGAHLVMSKPASPQTLFDRIAWISNPPRQFIECEAYVGPDRRFKHMGPPNGLPRRSTDLSIDIGSAVDPNMSQDEIDLLIKPTRISAE